MELALKNPLWKIYVWVLSWSKSAYGTLALFVIALAESSFFPVPPDVLLIALSVGHPKRAFWFATVCTVGSVIGGLLGYWIGALFWEWLGPYFFQYVPGFTESVFAKATGLYQEYAGWAVFVAGFTPIPYKVFTIAAGIASISLPVFIGASVISRALRFFLVAGLIRVYGEKVNYFIGKYFNLLSIIFCVLLIGGFFLVTKVF